VKHCVKRVIYQYHPDKWVSIVKQVYHLDRGSWIVCHIHHTRKWWCHRSSHLADSASLSLKL